MVAGAGRSEKVKLAIGARDTNGIINCATARIDLPYHPGPSKTWIKVKNTAHPAMLRVKEAFELERRR